MNDSVPALLKSVGFFAVVLALACAPDRALAADTSAGPMRTIQTFVGAMDKGDMKTADSTFSPSMAEITDDFAPHHWRGSHAVLAWANDFGKSLATAHITEPNITVAASKHTTVDGAHAFAPLPTIYTYKKNGKPVRETGVLVFALDRTGAAWKIVSMSWAPTP